MNTIKDLLKEHSKSPSEDVWERLSGRLDVEMPTGKSSSWSNLSVAKKTVIGVVSGLLVLGGVTLGALAYHPDRSSKPNDLAVLESMDKIEEVIESEVVEPKVVVEEAPDEELPVVKEVKPVVENPAPEEVPVQEVSNKTEKAPVKQNVKQEVLPANSTLAKQLAEDPVLKNLSDGSVDWSKPTQLRIPNLFTPNGDGVNDLFVIEGLDQYTSPKLIVRDKNGRVVYQSNNYQNTWGGRDCPEGIYYYEFTFFYNGIENQATGRVRIIRT